MRIPLRRAIVSVYDKTGVAELAAGLHAAGCEIVSTGSTAATIEAAGIPVTPVDQITGFPECFDGRVKTCIPRCTVFSLIAALNLTVRSLRNWTLPPSISW